MLSVTWEQHPVGHGGFHSARMKADGAEGFNWIFDCGSRRTARLNRFLEHWTDQRSEPVDWLFISHFDLDHVSGLDTLMARTVVRQVMVPYVNERELAYLLLYEIGRGNLSRSFFELTADPANYFLARGATGITFLGGRRRDEGDAIGRAPDDPKDDKSWLVKIVPPPRPLRTPKGLPAVTAEEPHVQHVESNHCIVDVRKGQIGLQLKPYRAPVQRRLHYGLIKALEQQTGMVWSRLSRPGLGDLAYAIANLARTRSGRLQLKRTFERYIGSSNRSSLSLLSIPRVFGSSGTSWTLTQPFRFTFGRGEAAWLNTGDAELLDTSDLAHWRAFFRPELAKVRVMALPHHGSDKNSDGELQNCCPDALFAAHVKSRSKKHPGVDVSLIAKDRLCLVTEEPSTEIQMQFDAT